ncbi:MAG: hypothetical protein EHM20_02265 [Alphaproteobacteria bacterium]|nr:MAG: hypothetical protein EHM20_02265 [Alphaproteobacteria bacterium]
MDDQNTSHAAPTAVVEATPVAPQMINGIKVYPTSYLPAKSVLETPRKALVEMHILHIEGIHIVMFFVITFVLFIGMWKRPNLR